MITQEEAKKLIQERVEAYHKLTPGEINRLSEEGTKKAFIEPLFEALGWNFKDTKEVTLEENVSRKRVDYAFRINGIPQFYLEAKPLKANLDTEKFIDQAINYAWHKGCTWAILTDFENVRVFNAEVKATAPMQSHFFTLTVDNFLENFDRLWLLSKESFKNSLLDKEAEKWGRKRTKMSVDKQLLTDFTHFRDLLSKDIVGCNLTNSKFLSREELDESVQRILDRLIFIRNCEDRQIEPPTLISALREWGNKPKFIKKLREVFSAFDENYNSKLFSEHLCDDLDVSNEVLNEIIIGLYATNDKTIRYDFSIIPADVLGNIYEQYLSHVLKKTKKRAKLQESKGKRKEQGIYYTPTYIVDYIVENTVGKLLKDKNIDPEKIRVLDPACGSGSFLIKSFDVINDYWTTKDKDYAQARLDSSGTTFTRKTEILKNNIFGVDLDKQAVEIAQLNLLLKIAEKRQRLPLLKENIKNGNSLIDNPNVGGGRLLIGIMNLRELWTKEGLMLLLETHHTLMPYN